MRSEWLSQISRKWLPHPRTQFSPTGMELSSAPVCCACIDTRRLTTRYRAFRDWDHQTEHYAGTEARTAGPFHTASRIRDTENETVIPSYASDKFRRPTQQSLKLPGPEGPKL